MTYVLDGWQTAICFLFTQDEKLKKLAELHGSEDWKLIASLLTVSKRACAYTPARTDAQNNFPIHNDDY